MYIRTRVRCHALAVDLDLADARRLLMRTLRSHRDLEVEEDGPNHLLVFPRSVQRPRSHGTLSREVETLAVRIRFERGEGFTRVRARVNSTPQPPRP